MCRLIERRRRALAVQLQQAKTPESAGRSRAGPQPRLWSVNLRLQPAGGPHFCAQDPAQPDSLLASVAPGSLDARRFAFDQVLVKPQLRCQAAGGSIEHLIFSGFMKPNAEVMMRVGQ